MSGIKGMQHYSVETKQEAIRLFLEEGQTYRAIAEKLGIRKQRRIEMWVRDYRRNGTDIYTRHQGRPRKVMDGKTYIARLEMENRLLKKLQSELRKDMPARRDIGQLTTTRKNTR